MAGEAKSKLTLLAEALGFDASAKSVDVMSEALKRLEANEKGLEQAKLEGIVGEVAKLSNEGQKLRSLLTEITPEQERLRVSTENYGRLLSTIHPQLGFFVGNLLRGANVAGELAGKNLQLGEVFKSLTDAVKNNASALALLGAGTAVVVGIAAIGAAIAKMREEFEKATAAIKAQNEALNELKRAEAEQQERTEDIAAKRREGGFADADAARRAGQQVRRVEQRFRGVVGREAVEQAAGFFGDEGLTDEELARTAFAVQRGLELDPKRRRESLRAARERGVGQSREAFDRETALEQTQAQEAIQEAGKQAASAIGTSVDLEALVRATLGPGTPEDVIKSTTERARQFQNLKGLQKGVEEAGGIRHMTVPSLWNRLWWGETPATPPTDQGKFLQWEQMTLSRTDLSDLTRVLDRLDQSLREEPRTVIHNNQNWRNVGPSGEVQRAVSVNGDRLKEALER